MYISSKTFEHVASACFRQWRAKSHCRFLHGYALTIHVEFEARDLDANNWVIDFGSLKPLKAKFEETFDHRLIVAIDDPDFEEFMALDKMGLAQVKVLPHVGCEYFARHCHELTERFLHEENQQERVRIVSVEVREHSANSAIYYEPVVLKAGR